jgi:hypothetical protein
VSASYALPQVLLSYTITILWLLGLFSNQAIPTRRLPGRHSVAVQTSVSLRVQATYGVKSGLVLFCTWEQ